MELKEIKVEGFSPNCLVGATEAIARYSYGIENVNKLFFHHSYLYKKGTSMQYNENTGGVNVRFTREIPVTKEQLVDRFYRYYGIYHYTADYCEYDEFINDIEYLTSRDEPLIMEIDFYYMRQHSFYQKDHDQHVMVVYEVDKKNQCFKVSEGVCGFSEISFSDYKKYFDNVLQNKKRPVHLLRVAKDDVDNKIDIELFKEDIQRTLRNLQNGGIDVLKQFTKDFSEFMDYFKEKSTYVPGTWIFMCDTMSCQKFIYEFLKDYPSDTYKSVVLLKNKFVKLYRQWFTFSMGIKDIPESKERIKKELVDIIHVERTLIDLLNSTYEEVSLI